MGLDEPRLQGRGFVIMRLDTLRVLALRLMSTRGACGGDVAIQILLEDFTLCGFFGRVHGWTYTDREQGC